MERVVGELIRLYDARVRGIKCGRQAIVHLQRMNTI